MLQQVSTISAGLTLVMTLTKCLETSTVFVYFLKGVRAKCAEAKADIKCWKLMSKTVWSCSHLELVRHTHTHTQQ